MSEKPGDYGITAMRTLGISKYDEFGYTYADLIQEVGREYDRHFGSDGNGSGGVSHGDWPLAVVYPAVVFF